LLRPDHLWRSPTHSRPAPSPLALWRRPLTLGLSVGHPNGPVGSIGPFVVLPGGRSAFLSASFVLSPSGARPNDLIHQPAALDTEVLTGSTRVATLARVVAAAPGKATAVDAAAAELLPGVETLGNELPHPSLEAGRTISEALPSNELRPKDEVAFVGCSSGFSRGRIAGVDDTVRVGDFIFRNCITAVADEGPFSHPGDAGALVYRRSDCRAVGMLFARGDGDRPISYLLPLAPMLEAFTVVLMS
jgi:hypothetical protein